MQFDLSASPKKIVNCTAVGPRERSVAVQIFAAHLLKPLLILLAALVIRAQVSSAVLDQFVAQFFTLRSAGTLKPEGEKQQRCGKYES